MVPSGSVLTKGGSKGIDLPHLHNKKRERKSHWSKKQGEIYNGDGEREREGRREEFFSKR